MIESGLSLHDNKNPENYQPIFHYTLIKNLSRLVCSQITKSCSNLWLCDRYLCHFEFQKSFEKHKLDCLKCNNVGLKLPNGEKEDDKILSLKDFKHIDKVPFIIYADLECVLVHENDCESEETNKPTSKHMNKHIPHSAAYYRHCDYDNSLSKFEINRAPDCITWLVKQFESISRKVDGLLKNVVKMTPLSVEEENYFNNAENCHICGGLFKSPDKTRCRDHRHLTGAIRGPSHQACNLNYKQSHIIPVVFHNSSGDDSHFIINSLARVFKGTLNILPVNKEKYISFTKSIHGTYVNLRFIDSFRLMSSSLDKLASNLTNDDKKITRTHFPNFEQFQLVNRKDDNQLPDQKSFYSCLNDADVDEKDYNHAKQVWVKFNIKTLGEYSDLYLKIDVLLLANVFENFRSSCYKTYELNPAHYYTSPGLAFSAMLKLTGVKSDLLDNPEIILFFEKGIRGSVSQCSNRYAKANNHFMHNFDPNEAESYLMYYDINNLYGGAMSMPLPQGSFKWLEDYEFDLQKIFNNPNQTIGYILEVDLDYSLELHETHKDLPLCPKHFIPPGSKQSKLCTTLYRKEKYIIHYKTLQQCLDLGLKLIKIHRVLTFNNHDG
ncbi:GSCOCG00012283001-RA-CDS [Cotesia congregata]|nr:GSCOCG00012283001-RA-CDS [Cotesia congregata]